MLTLLTAFILYYLQADWGWWCVFTFLVIGQMLSGAYK